jgi:hypothetical protein
LIVRGKIKPLIVVGIYNSEKRAEEYVPFNDEKIMEMMNMESWNGSLHMIFADFIVYDILPYIEEKYNASNEREDRAIFGSSFGGLNALWLGLDYTNEFSFIGVISPSVWVGDGAILRDMEIVDSIPDDKVWIDQGELEYDERNITLVKDLENQGLTYGENLWYYEHSGAQHNEVSWSQRVAYPIMLFQGINQPENNATAMEVSIIIDNKTAGNSRINAKLINEDGIKYSLLDKAQYKGTNISILSTGIIEGPIEGEAEISVTYNNQIATSVISN